MNRRLNDYLEGKGAEALDEGVLKEYATAMKERTIPEIERELKKNECGLCWSQRKPEGRTTDLAVPQP